MGEDSGESSAGQVDRPRALGRARAQAQVAAGVLDVLSGARPLTVVRAGSGFGKTAALDAWLARGAGGRRVVALVLGAGARTRAGFWSQLAQALGAPEGDDDARPAGLDALERVDVPTVLVLDDFHLAALEDEPDALDEDLLAVLRHNDLLDLVVGTRTLRALETIGVMTVDAAVVGPDELRLDAPAVLGLAQAAGVRLAAKDAARLAEDLGGWPALVRAAVRQPAEDTATLGSLEAITHAMARDVGLAGFHDFLLRTSVPDWLDAEVVGIVAAPASRPMRSVREAVANGILVEERTDGRARWHYPAAVREALRALAQDGDPDLVREVHEALVRHHEAARRPAPALLHAAHGQLWAEGLRLIETDWGQLLTDDPAALVAAAALFPAALADSNARLRVATQVLAGALEPGGSAREHWPVAGDAALAVELTADLGLGQDDDVAAEALVLLQWGISCLLCGNLPVAVYAFGHAHGAGLRADRAELVAGAQVGLALAHALDGDTDQARSWLARVCPPGSAPAPARDLIGTAARIADVLATADAALAGAGEAPDPTPAGARDEFWATAVFALAHARVLATDPEVVMETAGSVRAAIQHLDRSGLVAVTLNSSLVELLLAGGAIEAAETVARGHEGSVLAELSRAKVDLCAGRPEEALRRSVPVTANPNSSTRSRMEAWVVTAAARYATGSRSEAEEALRQALELAKSTGQRRPFGFINGAVFTELTRHDPGAAAWLPGTPVIARTAALSPAAIRLSARELAVLDALREHAGPVGIAAAFGVSVNTVKSQLRHLYRKLGVASREDALGFAELLGKERP